jgi:hypothetical protein
MKWREALRQALRFTAFSILWAITGGLVFAFGLATSRERPLLALLFFVIGYVIVSIGVFASLLKVLSEAIAKEVKGG